MKLNRWMTLLAVTGAMGSAPLFAAGTQGMQDQGAGMGDAQVQSSVAADQQASPDAIRKLQQSLNEKGHDSGPEDGLWGPKTQAALRDFQQTEGLDASGEINAETLTALDIDSSEFAAFGIKEDSAAPASPGAMDPGASGMQDSGGASGQGAPSNP